MIRYNYLRLLTKSVNDYQARELIASEIIDHIDDQKAAYMEEGMSEQEAEEKGMQKGIASATVSGIKN